MSMIIHLNSLSSAKEKKKKRSFHGKNFFKVIPLKSALVTA
jgi:hypothetical protein